MKIERPVPIVRRCLRSLHIGSGCTACIDACPAGALSLAEKRLRFSPSKCAGCGACASVCPRDAILFASLEDGGMEDRVRASAASGRAVFAARLARRVPGGAVILPSAAWLDEGWILFAAAEGAKEVVLVSAADSTEDRLAPLVAERLGRVRQVLAELGLAVKISWKRAAAKVDSGRRAWLSGILRAGEEKDEPAEPSAAAKALAAKLSGEPLKLVPESRTRLNGALKRLRERAASGKRGGEVPESAAAAALMPLPRISGGRCSGCGICAVICPDGALKMEKSADGTVIRLRPSACSGCGLCADVCFMKAVALEARASLAEALEESPVQVLAGGGTGSGLATWEDKLAGLIGAPVFRT